MAASRCGAGVQQGIEEGKIDYYDIMIIGRTGMGKSTTADKLLVANLTNRDYRGAEYTEPTVEKQKILADDLTIWLISEEVEKAKKRLKDLVMCRGLNDPHVEINFAHKEESPITRNCELISNETTKVRILDVPGFFGVDAGEASENSSLYSSNGSLPTSITRAQNMAFNDLGIMRKILHIQSAMRMEFKRILYFLPEKGPLERGSGNLQMELGSMEHYFNKSIFDCMVLIATMPASVYRHLPPDATPFDENDMKKTRDNFQTALRKVLPGSEPLPKPPIVFVSMFDSCEAIFDKIHRAPVAKNMVRLVFDSETCARCGIKTKMLGKDKVACYFGQNTSNTIPFEESTCHPLFMPKYSKLVKVLGGIAHLLTFQVFMGKWPSFKNMDEICIDCRRAPGSRGCKQIGKDFIHKGESIPVKHTNDENEPIIVEVEETEGGAHNDENYPIHPRETQPESTECTAEHVIVAIEHPQKEIVVEEGCYMGVPDQKGT